MSWLEIAIMIFIVGSIAWVVWRGGQANPESTGSLGKQFGGLSAKVTRLDLRVGHVESELAELQQTAATTKDIARIEQLINERIATVNAKMEGHHKLSEATNKAVDRIERVLIEKALGK